MEKIENIFRIEVPKNEARGSTIGWQFKMKRNSKQETKFFSDSVYGSKEAALDEAIKYKNERLEEVGDYSNNFLTTKISSRNTSGIIGVSRVESIRQKNERIEAVWQCHSPFPDGKVHYKSFSIPFYGEIEALYKAVEQRLTDISSLIGVENYKHCSETIKFLVEKYLNILIYLESVSDSDKEFIINIINNKKIDGTEKEKILFGRVGQSSYKDKLSRLWGNACCITGSKMLLQASHIKPWAVSTDNERLDPFNGLLLSPWYDKAFDNGHLSFCDSGEIIFSNEIQKDPIYPTLPVRNIKLNINEFAKLYMKYHRDNIFKR